QAPMLTPAEALVIDANRVVRARTEELMTPGESDDGVAVLLELLRRPRWMAWAACRGTDIEVFFPERGQDVKRGKAICAGCLVREECLKYALDHGRELLGTWAGTGEQERRRMRQVA
ncbi:MAG: WhiB family transcriptional regulator, partial [Acidimicrobiales bacterium]